jgi:ribosome recycling factor
MATDISEAKNKLEEVLTHFHDEAKKLRTGRANSSMLDNIMVEVYGQMTPLSHVATVKVVDAQLIQVQPFDPSTIEKIAAAIREDSSLGLNPADDGRVIRLPIPPMTEERRREVVKQLSEKVEESNIAMRNIRHDVLNTAKNQKNDGEIGEDELVRIEKQMTTLMDEYRAKIDEAKKIKEAEILKV